MKKNNRLNAILIIALILGFGFTVTAVRAARPVVVDSAVPEQAEQGTTNLTVIINGRGFDQNMDVKFCRSETNETCEDGGVDVKPDSVRFISAKKLEVTVDVGEEANIGNFDIEAISLSSGRRGRGTEKFAVLAPSDTYTVELKGRVFHVGSPAVDVTPDAQEDTLLPNPTLPVTFVRPDGDLYTCAGPNEAACLAWDAVFAACENFFGPNAILGPTPIVVSEFTVPPGNWRVNMPGGVRFQMSGILFDSAGNSPPIGDPHVQVWLQLVGDTLFENPDSPWLPVPGDPIEYNIVNFSISGRTVKGVHPKKGCVSGGSAETGDFDPGQPRTIKIEALAAPPP